MDQETIDKLKVEHGELHIIEADGHTVAVRMPTAAEFERFVETAQKKELAAMKRFLRDCLVYPSQDELTAMIAKRPGIFVPFAKELAKISGATVEAEGKKA